MPKLSLYSSVGPDELMAKAVDLLRRPVTGDDPLRTRWVIQPGRLWERDLRRRVADHGIAACLTFGSLRLTLERAFRLLCPGVTLQDENQLSWAVLDLLMIHENKPEAIGLTADSAPRLWLEANSRNMPLAQVQLARMLAGILDDHATYRPGHVLNWLGGKLPQGDGDEAWIAPLATAVWARPDSVRPLALQLPDFVQRLKAPAADRRGMPSAIVAVLTGAQPNDYLKALGALSLVCPVHWLVLETCERGLSDQMTTWKEVRAYWRASGCKQDLQAFVKQQGWLLPGTLQAFWGTAGIKLQQQLVEMEESLGALRVSIEESALDAMARPMAGLSRLATLQDDIRQTRAPRKQEDLLDRADTSVRLISATSPLRELEGARDAIRDALERDPLLQPSDVIMVLADPKRHAPLLPAVFGSGMAGGPVNGPDGLPRIPWHLVDRSLRTDSDTMAALLDIMAALGARITLPIVADLLAQPAIQARLGFSQGDGVDIAEVLKEAGFRWGLQQEDRASLNQPGRDDGMWTLDFALRRLAAGFAHPDAVRDPVGCEPGVTPLPAFEGLASARLAGFITWARALEMARGEYGQPRPLGREITEPGSWLEWLHRWVPRLIETGGEREGQSVWISRVTRTLAEGARQLTDHPRFSAQAFYVLLAEAASAVEQNLPLGQGIGGMTVASPRMARALPVRMIVVIGLSDRAWPRLEPLRPRGLLQKSLPGDRVRRDDDRLSSLEWVLSARQTLVWTWQGRQEQTGESVPPSVVVGELLDVCHATFLRPESVVSELPMHGFDPGLFLGGTASYDRIAADAATQLKAARGQGLGDRVRWEALPLPADPWGLSGVMEFARTGLPPPQWSRDQWIRLAERLVRFWKLPCREFLSVVGVQAEDQYEALPEREALALDGLAKWGLRDELLAERLRAPASDATLLEKRLARAGKLPPGPAGRLVFREAIEDAELIISAAQVAAGTTGVAVPLKAMDWSTGSSHLVRVSAGSNKAGKLLQARIEQAALARIALRPISCMVIGKPGGHKTRKAEQAELPWMAPDASLAYLQKLTALALLGSTFPLPFFPESGERYVTTGDIADAAMLFRDGAVFAGTEPESGKPACRLAYRGIDEPVRLGWPKAPDPASEWMELVEAASLPRDASGLFARVSLLVFDFWKEMQDRPMPQKEPVAPKRRAAKKGGKS
jgi:exodeoxyribonuclease V gamma subunit